MSVFTWLRGKFRSIRPGTVQGGTGQLEVSGRNPAAGELRGHAEEPEAEESSRGEAPPGGGTRSLRPQTSRKDGGGEFVPRHVHLAARGRSLFAELACSGSLAMSD